MMAHIKSYTKSIYIKLKKNKGIYKDMKKYYYIMLIIIMSVVIIISINPEYGSPRNLDYINYYLENGVRDTGAVNLVASIYLNYRTYDTLMETVVLFMAVLGVTLFLRKKEK